MSRFRTLIAALGLFALATGLSWLLMEKLSVLGIMERWISDVRIASLAPPQPQHPDIIVVTITEETLQRFPYRSPLDRKFLADLLQNLADKKVRGVLLDMLLDQPTEPEKDDLLKRVIAEYEIPLAVSYVDSRNLLTADQLAYVNSYVPKERLGLANLRKDPLDDTVRHIFPGKVGEDGSFTPGVVRLLAAKLGIQPSANDIEIAWRGSPVDAEASEPFKVFPAHMVSFLPPSWFANKIVLIGSDLSLRDRHRTPFSVIAHKQEGLAQFGMPGIFIFAHSLDQLLSGRQSPSPTSTHIIMILGGFTVLGTILAWVHLSLLVRLVMVVGCIPLFWVGGFYIFQQGGPLVPIIMPTLGLVFGFIFSEIYRGWDDRKKRAFLRRAFARYLSPELVDLLVQDPERLERGAERRELTFMFTDIEGFTTVSENSSPAELAPQMNIYLDAVCSTVLKHGGMVVDIIGDAVFAMFNAPLDQADHAERALKCALEVALVSKKFQNTPEAVRLGFGRTRIGINTGEALVGNFGSEDRFKYTPLGDAVNTGARIEGLNKYFATQILASGKSVKAASIKNVRPIGEVVLKGKKEPIKIFEVIADGALDKAYLDEYKTAFELLKAKRKKAAEATNAFLELSLKNPSDQCVAFHLARLQNGDAGIRIKMDKK